MDKLFIVADPQSVKLVFEEILNSFYVVICCFLDVLNRLGIFWLKSARKATAGLQRANAERIQVVEWGGSKAQ